jgi:2Fe-2S ferredoxin
MAKINVISQTGSAKQIDAPEDLTLMEAIKNSGFDELRAFCGGNCSCATCQVYIDVEYLRSLPPISEEEAELLAESGVNRPNSRLSCQVPVTSVLDGAGVTIAPDGDA